jgi:hypothetical protein
MKNSRSLDTTSEVEEVQVRALRSMTPEQRLDLAIQLTKTSRGLLAAGIRLRHPEYTDEMVRYAVIKASLPEDLFSAAYPEFSTLCV